MNRQSAEKKKPKESSDRSEKSIHVRLNSRAYESSIAHDEDCCLDNTISFTSADQTHDDNAEELSDPYSAEGMRKRGWCNNDGTPWAQICPHDEAALLKKGVVSRDCKRASYGAVGDRDAQPPLFDELELFRANLIDKHGRPTRHFYDFRRVEQVEKTNDCRPITTQELTKRGFVDSCGKKHSGVELANALDAYFRVLKDESVTEITFKSKCVPSTDDFNRFVFSSPELSAESSIADFQLKTAKSSSCARLASKLSSKTANLTSRRDDSGTLRMSVGTAEDRGTLSYSVTPDGRTYELQTAKQNVVLEFAKKVVLVGNCGHQTRLFQHSCLVFHSN